MAKVTIGGHDYEVPELNFVALERAWPFIEKAMLTQGVMEGPSAGISVIAAGLIEADNFKPQDFDLGPELGEEQTFEGVVKFLKRKLKATEIINVKVCLEEICKEAGLEAKEGEAPLPPGENPSTETLTASSQSLLPPDAKLEAGTGFGENGA